MSFFSKKEKKPLKQRIREYPATHKNCIGYTIVYFLLLLFYILDTLVFLPKIVADFMVNGSMTSMIAYSYVSFIVITIFTLIHFSLHQRAATESDMLQWVDSAWLAVFVFVLLIKTNGEVFASSPGVIAITLTEIMTCLVLDIIAELRRSLSDIPSREERKKGRKK